MTQPHRDQLRDSLAGILAQATLFSSCTPQQRDAFAAKAVMQAWPKGKILFLHEDAAEYCYVIQQGWVKLFRETLDGDQAIVDILTAGHLFGETSIFNDGLYPYSAEVVEQVRLIAIPLEVIRAEIEANSDFAFAMLSAMARYRRQQDRELEHRTLQNAPQRIGCFLLRLVDQKALLADTGKQAVTIHLPYDKTLVASRLGMQPETFSRALAKLKQETGLRIKGATIELDSLQALSRYSCAACSSEFPCKDQ